MFLKAAAGAQQVEAGPKNMPARQHSRLGRGVRLTFKHIIQIKKLLLIIDIITATILLVTGAFGRSSPVA